MNPSLRDRIMRKLESLSDERGYQVLDYAEFLESKYAERQSPQANSFTRFTEAIEDRLRAGKVSAAAIAETMSLLNRAANVLNGAVAAGRSVATDLYAAAQSATGPGAPRPGGTPSASSPPSSTPPAGGGAAQPKEASSPARDVPRPGSGEEHL